MDRHGNTAHLLRLRQHTSPISCRHDRDDRRGLHRAGRTGFDLFRLSGADPVSHSDHVKLVGLVNYSAIPSALPRGRPPWWRGHHGAALRAGIPMVVLWDVADQPLWAAQVIRMEGRSCPTPVYHYPGIVGRGTPPIRRAALCDPSPGDRHPDDQAHRKRHRGRRSPRRHRSREAR